MDGLHQEPNNAACPREIDISKYKKTHTVCRKQHSNPLFQSSVVSSNLPDTGELGKYGVLETFKEEMDILFLKPIVIPHAHIQKYSYISEREIIQVTHMLDSFMQCFI